MAKHWPLLQMNDLSATANLILSQDTPLGKIAIAVGCTNFQQLCEHVASMPYRRNQNRYLVEGVLTDNCGTCSSKHRLLAAVAEEHARSFSLSQTDWKQIRLYIGVFEMNAFNTPAIATILEQYELSAIPEAHCYLKWNEQILDHTSNRFSIPFRDTLLYEQEVDAASLYEIKDTLHKSIIDAWRITHAPHLFTETIWVIREKCIAALSR